MTELATITLENEMDLTLAYKRSILTASKLGLTVATQTAFATAVSEVCREVIDKAMDGIAVLGTTADSGRYFMTARVTCKIEEEFKRNTEGFEYARKLVPVLEMSVNAASLEIMLKLGIPRATRIDQRKIVAVKRQIEEDGPVSAYEEVKQKNAALAGINQQQELALVHAQYLNEQKNEFLSVASHELNSPLTVLRSYAQIALRVEGGKNETLHKYLSKIDFQTAKLVTLVRQLMDVSKMEQGEISYDMQRISAHSFLNNALEPLQLLVHTHNVSLELGDDAEVMMDTLRIEQVLNNLAGNAAKYSEPGSAISLRSSVNKGHLVVEVEDQGIGMSPETQRLVFDKFYRDKQIEKKYSGLGMGLYIASRIITDHDGSLTVASKEGEGSVFSFMLPLAKSN